jgi:peroxiredoxin-like protein
MKEKRSEFVRGDWQGGFSGVGKIESGDFLCSVSAPSAIGGSGEGVSPSSLLVAAASGCFLLTLVGLLEQRGIRVVGISFETEGVFRGSAPPELCAVIHRPTVVVERSHASRLTTVHQCFGLAKVSCMAARAMPSVTFTVEGSTMIEGQMAETSENRSEPRNC